MTLMIDADSTDEPVIVMSRIIDAPREKVWEAHTRSEHVARWYGGHGFSNPVCEMDVRPGGHWRHVMRTPDGNDYKLHFVFVTVDKPAALAWRDTDFSTRPPGHRPTSLITVTFTDLGAKTGWRMVARFNSFADRDAALGIGFTRVLTEGTERFADVVRRL